jgi:hypothetical protein
MKGLAMQIRGLLLLFLCVATVQAVAEDSPPQIDATALLRQAIERWQNANTVAAKYTMTVTEFPVKELPDMAAGGTYECVESELFLERPDQLCIRDGLIGTSYLHYDGRVARWVARRGESLRLTEWPLEGDVNDFVSSGRISSPRRVSDVLTWLVRNDSVEAFFSRAKDVRQVGFVLVRGSVGNPARCARIAFEGYDGNKWELWIDPAEKRLCGARVASEETIRVLRSLPSGMPDEETLRNAPRLTRACEQTVVFRSVFFDEPLPENAFTLPPAEPNERVVDDHVAAPPTHVPDFLGRNAAGGEVRVNDLEGRVWVALRLHPNLVTDELVERWLRVARLARERLGDPRRVLVFLTEENEATRAVLASPEFSGVTLIHANDSDAIEALFRRGPFAIVGGDGSIRYRASAQIKRNAHEELNFDAALKRALLP